MQWQVAKFFTVDCRKVKFISKINQRIIIRKKYGFTCAWCGSLHRCTAPLAGDPRWKYWLISGKSFHNYTFNKFSKFYVKIIPTAIITSRGCLWRLIVSRCWRFISLLSRLLAKYNPTLGWAVLEMNLCTELMNHLPLTSPTPHQPPASSSP